MAWSETKQAGGNSLILIRCGLTEVRKNAKCFASLLASFDTAISFMKTRRASLTFIIFVIEVATQVIAMGVFLSSSLDVHGQSVNDGFNPGITNPVSAVAVQADGRILVAGQFLHVAGVPRTNLARLNPDGTLDLSYLATVKPRVNSGGGPQASLTVQPDGKVLVIGSYVTASGPTFNGLVRLNINGSIDENFRPYPSTLYSLLGYRVGLQPDGRILILDGISVIQLNPDGSTNALFPTGFNAWNLVTQRDGRYLLAGGISFPIDGSGPQILRRFSSSGVRDPGFAPYIRWEWNVIEYTHISSLAVQPDGGVLVAGWFSSVNTQSIAGLLPRIRRDGNLDTNAIIGPAPGYLGTPNSYLVQADGRILVITTARQLKRHLHNGAIDPTFNFDWDLNSSFPICMAVQPDGKILIGGSFSRSNGLPRGLLRLYPDGTFDDDFMGLSIIPQSLAVQSDGKLLASDYEREMMRFRVDGQIDSGFPTGVVTNVQTICVQYNDALVVGGSFLSAGGLPRKNIARLSGASGSIDPDFKPQLDGGVRAITQLDDGRLLVGGLFNNVDGQARRKLVRLQTNGVVDASFASSVFAMSNCVDCSHVAQFIPQPDGKVLVSGEFKLLNGGGRTNVARLNRDGTLDLGFRPASGGIIEALQRDGRVLINRGDVISNQLVRLNADGTKDSGFNHGIPGWMTHSALQADGKLVLASERLGNFGATVSRLNADGTSDDSFASAYYELFWPDRVSLMADGKVFLPGQFPIRRLSNPTAGLQAIAVDESGNQIVWRRGGASPEVERVLFEVSTDGTNFTTLGYGVPRFDGWQISNANLPFNKNVFIRARGRITTSGWQSASSSLIESVALAYLTPTIQGPRITLTGCWLQGSNHVLEYHFPNPSGLAYQLLATANPSLPTFQWQRQPPPELDFFDLEGRYVFWVTSTNAARYFKLHLP